MAQESDQRRGVTEMHVRMDCNGCVNRIKKALHSVDGVYEVQVNFSEQKLTVIGRAAPEKMLRAIKKTRKTATVLSHTEPGGDAPDQQAPPPPAEPAPPVVADHPPADVATDLIQPPAEAPPAESPAPEQQTQDPPAAAAPEEVEVKPSPDEAAQPADPPADPAKDVGEIHTTDEQYCRQRRRAYQEDQWVDYRPRGGYLSGVQYYEAPYSSTTVIHSYSRHGAPAGHVSEYGHLQLPPPQQSLRYAVVEPYGELRGGDGSSITSMFSDENPNACTIV